MEGISDMPQERRQRSIVVIVRVVVTRSTERTPESAYVKWASLEKVCFLHRQAWLTFTYPGTPSCEYSSKRDCTTRPIAQQPPALPEDHHT